MSSQSAPAPPDYTPIANAQQAASAEQTQLARDQFDWAKKTYLENKGTTDKVVDDFLQTQDRASANAAADRKRYEDVFQPQEDALVADANSYASDDRKALEMGAAEATVGQQFQAARTNAAQALESYGINPSATRFAALDIGTRTQEAAAKAGSANLAARNVDATARDLRAQAINIGKGYPAQSTSESGTALNAGTGAVNSNLATTASGANTMGTAPGYYAGSNSSLAAWGSTLNQGYQNALGAYNANQQASSGVGSALGLIGGLATSAIPGSSLLGRAFAADGGEIGDGATPGGAVPVGASPSGGQTTDDVPSALTVGEFVIPKDTVTFKGTEFFHKLITKTREDQAKLKAQSGAIPSVRPAAAQRPNFVSRPGGALPVQRAA